MPVDASAASAAAAELKALSEAASKKSDEGRKNGKAASSSAGGGSKSDHDEALDTLAELVRRPAAKSRAGARTAADSDGDDSDSDSEPRKAPDTPIGEAKALVAQLAALSGDDEEVVAAVVTEHLAHGGELPEVPEGDEPINRGLLLKFLSSVRN
jgi:hypothetical protein